MKIETINFNDFTSGNYGYKTRDSFKLLSLVPGAFLAPSTWLNPPALIANGYMIVIGVGAVLIIAAILEMLLARNGYTELASSILDFFKFVFPLAFIAALVFFVLSNPLL